MLLDERRANKPYALPVRYVPCRTLKDQFIRDMTKDLKQILYLTGKLTKLYEPFSLFKKQYYVCTWREQAMTAHLNYF